MNKSKIWGSPVSPCKLLLQPTTDGFTIAKAIRKQGVEGKGYGKDCIFSIFSDWFDSHYWIVFSRIGGSYSLAFIEAVEKRPTTLSCCCVIPLPVHRSTSGACKYARFFFVKSKCSLQIISFNEIFLILNLTKKILVKSQSSWFWIK